MSEYCELSPEGQQSVAPVEHRDAKSLDDIKASAPESWPRSGRVEFRNVTVRYDPDGPDILKNINLTFNAGERTAIVGRTGSGKSTV